MANVPQPGAGSRNLREAIVRGLVLLAGLFIGIGGLIARLLSGRPLGVGTYLILYLALTAFIWGLNGFAFRRVALGAVSLLLFSGAAFGVLFLLGYFVGGVAGPFVADAANRLVPYLHLTDAIFFL